MSDAQCKHCCAKDEKVYEGFRGIRRIPRYSKDFERIRKISKTVLKVYGLFKIIPRILKVYGEFEGMRRIPKTDLRVYGEFEGV